MKVIINPSSSLRVTEETNDVIHQAITDTFSRFGSSVTRIEAFLTNENDSNNGIMDKRCLLEACVAHQDPVVVSANSPKLYAAVDSAIDKLESAMDRTIGRLSSEVQSV